jgi:hypothetical protein
MTTLSKTLVAAAAFAAIATSAFSQAVTDPGMAVMFSGGKMMQMAMASGPKNHDAMMKDAKKGAQQHRVLHERRPNVYGLRNAG